MVSNYKIMVTLLEPGYIANFYIAITLCIGPLMDWYFDFEDEKSYYAFIDELMKPDILYEFNSTFCNYVTDELRNRTNDILNDYIDTTGYIMDTGDLNLALSVAIMDTLLVMFNLTENGFMYVTKEIWLSHYDMYEHVLNMTQALSNLIANNTYDEMYKDILNMTQVLSNEIWLTHYKMMDTFQTMCDLIIDGQHTIIDGQHTVIDEMKEKIKNISSVINSLSEVISRIDKTSDIIKSNVKAENVISILIYILVAMGCGVGLVTFIVIYVAKMIKKYRHPKQIVSREKELLD
jgi:hypothetical protein